MLWTLKSRARLNNGVEIPRLGLGVYQSPPGRITQHAVKYALNLGYRHIDTASVYGNEADVGMALRESGLRREEVLSPRRSGTATKDMTRLCERVRGACDGSG
jgi:diketogulonate reductase-like aldo/keto reductase